MKNLIQRTFLEHPQSVEESYFEHLLFALKFSGKLFFASLAALIHALIPSFCEKTASNTISDLHRRMHNR